MLTTPPGSPGFSVSPGSDHGEAAEAFPLLEHGRSIELGRTKHAHKMPGPGMVGSWARARARHGLLSYALPACLLALVLGACFAARPTRQRDVSFEGLAHSLRGKRVVMIGDSLMRYKFITLVSYLETGMKLSSMPNGNSSADGSRNPVIHTTWGTWYSFFAGSLPYASCDCFHGEGNSNFTYYKTDISENRHYGRDGYDIAFHQYFINTGSCTMAGWTGVGDHSLDVQPHDWCKTFTGFMDHLVRNVQPDLVLLNSGAWQQVDAEFVSGLAQALPLLRQVVWLKTTQNNREVHVQADHDEPVLALFRENNTRHSVADTWTLSMDVLRDFGPGPVWVDDVHVHSFVYEMMLTMALSHV